jgi:hypothetical protein
MGVGFIFKGGIVKIAEVDYNRIVRKSGKTEKT